MGNRILDRHHDGRGAVHSCIYRPSPPYGLYRTGTNFLHLAAPGRLARINELALLAPCHWHMGVHIFRLLSAGTHPVFDAFYQQAVAVNLPYTHCIYDTASGQHSQPGLTQESLEGEKHHDHNYKT